MEMIRIFKLAVILFGLCGCVSFAHNSYKYCIINSVNDGVYCKIVLDSSKRKVVLDFCSDREIRVLAVSFAFTGTDSSRGRNYKINRLLGMARGYYCGSDQYFMKTKDSIVFDNLDDNLFLGLEALSARIEVKDVFGNVIKFEVSGDVNDERQLCYKK